MSVLSYAPCALDFAAPLAFVSGAEAAPSARYLNLLPMFSTREAAGGFCALSVRQPVSWSKGGGCAILPYRDERSICTRCHADDARVYGSAPGLAPGWQRTRLVRSPPQADLPSVTTRCLTRTGTCASSERDTMRSFVFVNTYAVFYRHRVLIEGGLSEEVSAALCAASRAIWNGCIVFCSQGPHAVLLPRRSVLEDGSWEGATSHSDEHIPKWRPCWAGVAAVDCC